MSPPNRLARLPRWISHWLGYREAIPTQSRAVTIHFWSFVGAFCGLSVIQAIFYNANVFVQRHVPLVASFGASAVLCYGSIDLPLAQPRSLMGGHFISAVLGVCICKLFEFLPTDKFDSLRWLAASLSTATAIVAMQMTKTTHPPAGATALLPILDDALRQLSWYYIPVILLSSTMVLVTALLLNNMQRRYPTFWFTPPMPPPATVKASPAAAVRSASITQSEPTFPITPEPVLKLEDFKDWYSDWHGTYTTDHPNLSSSETGSEV